MREVETLFLEIKIYDDGAIRARRKDRTPLTDDDRAEARKVADSQARVTVDDVLRVFRGATVISKT
jgi:hypothetical protein